MRRIMNFTGICLLLLIAAGGSVRGADADELMAAYRAMETPRLSESDIFFARDFAISHQDFKLQLDSAFLHFFEPIEVDGKKHFWGAYIEGTGLFQFAAPTRLEQQQLRLFLDSDSLHRRFYEGVILFNDTLATEILAGTERVESFRGEIDKNALKDGLAAFVNNENKLFLFETLRNCVFPLRRPFLIASVLPENTDRLIYMFDPYVREEVQLFKDYKEFLVSLYFEQVCSYSVYADESHVRVNGIARERIKPTHYSIETSIDARGDVIAVSTMQCTVQLSPTQLVVLQLHPELVVDSVRAGDADIGFLRYSSWENKSDSLYLVLDRAYNKGDSLELSIAYHGDMVPAGAPVFLLQGEKNWYPGYRAQQQATYDLRFTVPKEFPFQATGTLVSDSSDARFRYTHWRTPEPSPDVSFTVGEYDQYRFATEVAPIEILVSDALHREMRQQYSGDMRFGDRHAERQVADDVSQALKLFNRYFGEYDHDRLVVTESYLGEGQSTPGMAHLSWEAVFFADLWGDNRLHRASVVSRQWWGSGVLSDTYRDRWLSDGFADYSGLLFLQAAEGNDRFLWWLDKYRDQTLSLYGLLSGDKKPVPPLAVGHRALSSRTTIYAGSLDQVFQNQGEQILERQEARSSFEIEDDAVVRRRTPTREYNRESTVPEFKTPKKDSSGMDLSYFISHKGAFVLHMIRNLLMDLQTLDDSQFYMLMKDWYVTYNGKRATTQDFRRMTEKYTGLDMGWFFDQWVYGSAIPTYEFSYNVEDEPEDGRYKASVTIKQKDVPETFQMFVPIEIKFRGDKRFYMRLLVDRPELTVQLPPMDQKPEKIVLNPFHSVLARVKQ